MIVGILDFETTGLDTATCHVNEHALILAELDPLCEERPHILAIDTSLWFHQNPVPSEVTQLTGIDSGLLERFGQSPDLLTFRLLRLLNQADVIVGHNLIRYDREILARVWMELGNDAPRAAALGGVFHKPVIDTKFDLPVTGKSSSLTYMAADYGIANPNAHRALFDCETVLALLGRMNCLALDQAEARSREELVEIVAETGFMNKDAVKNRGYFWTPEDKTWRKIMRMSDSRSETTILNDLRVAIVTVKPLDLPFYRKAIAHGNA